MPSQKRRVAKKLLDEAEKKLKRKKLYFQLCEIFDTNEESDEENTQTKDIFSENICEDEINNDIYYNEFDQEDIKFDQEDPETSSDSEDVDDEFNCNETKIHQDSNLTVEEVDILLVKWMIANNITKKAMNQLLTILNVCIPSSNFTTSTYKCLEHKSKLKDFQNMTSYRRNLKPDSELFKQDVYAAKAYEKYQAITEHPGATTSFMWGDGLTVSKAKMNSITLVSHVINEMSPFDRFKHENIILETLWCTKNPVKYKLIFQNQIDDWKKLMTGIF
jgi:hypothetical protein